MNLSTIVKPSKQKVFQQDNCYCVYDQNQISNFSAEMLTPNYWQDREAVVGFAQGRGTTYFVEHRDQQWVLRHYYRGGFIGKLINDSYLFVNQQMTRAAREFDLLQRMSTLGLPVPKPIAYRVVRSGFFYQADLLTERIKEAKDLVTILAEQRLPETTWIAIGQTIQAFHQQGIYHHDLNAHNILIDQKQKIWLIDFDRGQQKLPNKRWQHSNMQRLLRSFNKEVAKATQLHWHIEDWQALERGYQTQL